MSDMRLVVAGADGRMGRALIRAISADSGAVLASALERRGSPMVGRDAGENAGLPQLGVAITGDPTSALAAADGIVDFTAPAVSVALAEAAAQASIVHVIGTTGLSKADQQALDLAGRRAVIVQSGNMSLGVNLLAQFVRQAARALDESFDIEIAEMHHRDKVDAPSGTALMFGRAAAEGRGVDLASHSIRVRDGHTGPRRRGDIGFAALRGGSAAGDHTVLFAGEGETIELSHHAYDRSIFARGAIRAALWGRERDPGRYTMADVLGLKTENSSD